MAQQGSATAALGAVHIQEITGLGETEELGEPHVKRGWRELTGGQRGGTMWRGGMQKGRT